MIPFAAFTFFFQTSSQAQCGYGGVYMGDMTPGAVGQTTELLNWVWGGEQYSLNAQAGCTYTISTCGGGWDTQITVFDPALLVAAYNDDACGLQSSVTFTALTTGTYTIQINQWFCGSNFTNLPYFGVTWDSCAGGCSLSFACNYDPASTDNSNCCFQNCVSFQMLDSFGDGWNGAT
ncbi:MAG: hypothetical protein HKN32_07560, partial [Flavobacteriales bacterium]|nr:hypothetical protein [Flavobacteriales bacterium]